MYVVHVSGFHTKNVLTSAYMYMYNVYNYLNFLIELAFI